MNLVVTHKKNQKTNKITSSSKILKLPIRVRKLTHLSAMVTSIACFFSFVHIISFIEPQQSCVTSAQVNRLNPSSANMCNDLLTAESKQIWCIENQDMIMAPISVGKSVHNRLKWSLYSVGTLFYLKYVKKSKQSVKKYFMKETERNRKAY